MLVRWICQTLARRAEQAEAQRDTLAKAAQRVMEISTALAAADIVGHHDVLNLLGAAIAQIEEKKG
jgi:hypothetical protein